MKKIQFDDKTNLLLSFSLIALAVLSRFAPHPANFAPIAAVAMFAGAVLPRKMAISVPLLAIVISDIFIGLHSLVFFTWGSFVLIALLSSKTLRRVSASGVLATSMVASVLFYLVTNFGVWAEGRLYDHSIAGLMSSYYNALPFFRNTLLSDVVYSSILFGAYALAVQYAKSPKGLKAVD